MALTLEATGNFGGLCGYWYGPKPWLWLSWLTHIVLAAAPLLWLAGLFPPFEAFILWFGEQLQIFAFGGSATTSQLRFWTYLGLSLAQLVTIYLLSYLDMSFIITLATKVAILVLMRVFYTIDGAASPFETLPLADTLVPFALAGTASSGPRLIGPLFPK